MRTIYREIPRSRSPRISISINLGSESANRWDWTRALKLFFLRPAKWQAWLLSWICFLVTLYFIWLVAFGWYTRQLTVPPIELPPSLQKRGYTPESVAKQVTTEMREMSIGANIAIQHEVITGVADSKLNVRIPGQEVTYQSIVDFLKQRFGRPDVAVRIDIVEGNDSALIAHLRIDGGAFDRNESTVVAEGRDSTIDVDKFIKDIGDTAMQLAQPNVLASHLVKEIEGTHCDVGVCNFYSVEQIYNKVIESSALDPAEQALAGKGDLLIIEARWKDAEEFSAAELVVHNDSAALHQTHAVALEGLGSIDKAIAELRDSVKLPSATADTWRIFGDVLMHAEDPDKYREALHAFAEANRLRPDFSDNLHDWGEALLQVGDVDKATEKFERAVALDPANAPSYVGWGRALDCKGDLRGAIQKYDVAYHFNKKHLQAHRYLLAAREELTSGGASFIRPTGDVTSGEGASRGWTSVGYSIDDEVDRCRGRKRQKPVGREFRLVVASR